MDHRRIPAKLYAGETIGESAERIRGGGGFAHYRQNTTAGMNVRQLILHTSHSIFQYFSCGFLTAAVVITVAVIHVVILLASFFPFIDLACCCLVIPTVRFPTFQHLQINAGRSTTIANAFFDPG